MGIFGSTDGESAAERLINIYLAPVRLLGLGCPGVCACQESRRKPHKAVYRD